MVKKQAGRESHSSTGSTATKYGSRARKASLYTTQKSSKTTTLSNEFLKTKLFNALEDKKYTWRTAQGIASQMGLSEDKVLELIAKFDDFIVQSSHPAENGKYIYTTRSRFNDITSPFQKIIGAFKGRMI